MCQSYGGAVGSITEVQPERSSGRRRLGVGLAAILGVLSGFFGSIFGPFTSMIVGGIVTVIGGSAVLTFRVETWPRVVLAIGIAVVIGSCGYILVGILSSQGAGSGSGSGCMPGGMCRP